MSINGPQSGIRFSGLSSGIDVESIVSRLVQLERFPIQRLQARQAQAEARQSIYSQFRSTLISLNTAASALSTTTSFQTNKTSSADESIATATATESAVAGTYSVNVTTLAKAHKVTSAAQASTTDAIGLTGSFMVNGKAVTVTATDSLSSISAKINGLNVGVSANVVNGGTGQAYLVMGSSTTGAANSIKMNDLTGGVASALGLVNGTTSFTSLSGSVAKSGKLTSSTEKLSTLTGASQSGSLTLGSDVIAFDTSADSLQDVANRINATGNHTATVTTETKNGVTTFQLNVNSTAWPATYSDPDNLLGVIGMTQLGVANQVTAATDAAVTVDGIAVSSSSNTLSDVVGGMTFTLKKEGTASVTVSKDTTAVKQKIKDFQSAYNNVIDYIRGNSEFDSETFQSGALFGDQTAAQVESTLNSLLFNNVGTGAIRNLSDLGFTLDDKGKLELSESKLDTAIGTNLEGVKNLLLATGSSANSEIKYVSSGNKTIASTGGGYSLNITQAATKSQVTALNAFSAPHSGGETLTFSGALFGNSVNLTIGSGTDLNSLISQINSDSRLKDLVVASNSGGSLVIESKRFGTPGDFSVSSNLAAGADNSGIGTTGGTKVLGLNVAGTINGEAATGNGQFLIGNSGNANTDGLQIQYTGTTTGGVGSVSFTRGVASLMSYRVGSFTDSVNGLLTAVDQSLKSQVEDIQGRIDRLEELVTQREQTLRLRYAAMEEAIGRFNSQGSQLGAIVGGLNR